MEADVTRVSDAAYSCKHLKLNYVTCMSHFILNQWPCLNVLHVGVICLVGTNKVWSYKDSANQLFV